MIKNFKEFIEPYEFDSAVEEVMSNLAKKGLYKEGDPTPMEKIVDYIGFTIIFDDLDSINRDTLGCIDFENKRIYVDNSLADGDSVGDIGRYNFTLAHECGHFFCKHDAVAKNLLLNDHKIIAEKKFLETQANMFGARLLMRKGLLIEKNKEFLNLNYHESRHKMAIFFGASIEALEYRMEKLGLSERVDW
jgi:Zn-dependent peptidase ImmA (M78 family)